jgi:hypothetical protein
MIRAVTDQQITERENMKQARALFVGIIVLTMVGPGAWADDEGKEVKLADLSKAVQKTVNEHSSGSTIDKIMEQKKDDQVIYVVHATADGTKEQFTVDSTGKFLEGDKNHNKRKGHDSTKEKTQRTDLLK